MQQLIRQETQVGMPIRTVGLYLKRWGYTCKKPSRHHQKQDPQEVKVWLEQTYPQLKKQARREGATIFWADEMGVAADAYPGSGYARIGERSTIEVPDSHIKMNVISAIANEGSIRFMTYPGMMNADLFLVFLERLIRSVPEKIYLIVDRLRAHDAQKVWQWVSEHEDRIKLGGLRGLVHLCSILGNIGVIVLPDQIAVPKVHEAFAEDGSLKDAKQQASVQQLGKKFAETAKKLMS